MGTIIPKKRSDQQYAAKLHLVSLMDIFTILVFFLLLNTGDNQSLEKAEFVKLPQSSASSAMGGDLIVVIGEDQIFLGDLAVADVDKVLKNPDKEIAGLKTALDDYSKKIGNMNSYEKANGRSVTIMGDKAVPYTLLKSVMSTCGKNTFRDISLAVNQIPGSNGFNSSNKASEPAKSGKPRPESTFAFTDGMEG